MANQIEICNTGTKVVSWSFGVSGDKRLTIDTSTKVLAWKTLAEVTGSDKVLVQDDATNVISWF